MVGLGIAIAAKLAMIGRIVLQKVSVQGHADYVGLREQRIAPGQPLK